MPGSCPSVLVGAIDLALSAALAGLGWVLIPCRILQRCSCKFVWSAACSACLSCGYCRHVRLAEACNLRQPPARAAWTMSLRHCCTRPTQDCAGPRSSPDILRLSNNRTQNPNEQVPDTAWQFFWWSTSPGCKLEGNWVLEADHNYPNERAWTHESESKVTFEFEGSEVWPGCAQPSCSACAQARGHAQHLLHKRELALLSASACLVDVKWWCA